MPVYDYQCCECQKVTEFEFSINEYPKETRCPKCNGRAKKIISFSNSGGRHKSGHIWDNAPTWLQGQEGLDRSHMLGKPDQFLTRNEHDKLVRENGIAIVDKRDFL